MKISQKDKKVYGKYYRDDSKDNITQSESFKLKIKMTGKTPADGNTKMLE